MIRNKFFRYFVIVGVSWLMGCEEEFNKPVFHTQPATPITAEGVTFNAAVLTFAAASIELHGFVWSTSSNPELSDTVVGPTQKSFAVHLPGQPAAQYSITVKDGLMSGKLSYVRAFMITKGHVLYGNQVAFTPIGTSTPSISDFQPKSGTPGASIEITGKNFGTDPSGVQVLVNGVSCLVTNVSSRSVVFKIPSSYAPGTYPITLQVNGKAIVTHDSLQLFGPLIQSFFPTEGYVKSTVTITGSGFLPSSTVWFDNHQAVVIHQTSDTLKVLVPVADKAGPTKIAVDVGQVHSTAGTNFNIKAPIITSVSPAVGTFGTKMTVTGEGFSDDLFQNYVWIAPSPNGQSYGMQVVRATRTELDFYITNLVYNGSLTEMPVRVDLITNNLSVAAPGQFTFQGPTISAVSPTNFYTYSTLDISGARFAPDQMTIMLKGKTNNNNFLTTVNQATESLIGISTSTFYPPGKLYDRDYYVRIQIQDFTYTSPVPLTLLSRWKKISDFPALAVTPATGFTIGKFGYLVGGQGVGVLSSATVWRLDLETYVWTQVTDFPGAQRSAAFSFVVGSKAYVGGGVDLTNNQPLRDVWSYDSSNDSWTQEADMPAGIASSAIISSATSFNNAGYFISSRQLYKFDTVLGSWTAQDAPISTILGNAHVAQAFNGMLYFSDDTVRAIWQYDPANNTWFQTNGYATLDLAFSFPLIQGKLYGLTNSFQFVNYDPASRYFLNALLDYPAFDIESGAFFGYGTKCFIANPVSGSSTEPAVYVYDVTQ